MASSTSRAERNSARDSATRRCRRSHVPYASDSRARASGQRSRSMARAAANADVGGCRRRRSRGEHRSPVRDPDPPPRHLHPDGVCLEATKDRAACPAAIGRDRRVGEVRDGPAADRRVVRGIIGLEQVTELLVRLAVAAGRKVDDPAGVPRLGEHAVGLGPEARPARLRPIRASAPSMSPRIGEIDRLGSRWRSRDRTAAASRPPAASPRQGRRPRSSASRGGPMSTHVRSGTGQAAPVGLRCGGRRSRR